MTTLLACALSLVSAVPQADLSLDERLKSAITVEASVKTTKEVLDDLAQRTGVSISVQDDLREDLITLYAKERPAHEVLARIAQHFGWEWRKTEDGYTLTQSAEAAARERKELEEEIFKPFEEAKKRAQEHLQKSTPEQLAKVRAEIEELRKKAREMRDPEDEEFYRVYGRLYELEEATSPGALLEALFVAQLSSRECLELDRLGKIVYSTHPTALQRPMPRAVVEQLPWLVQQLSVEPGFPFRELVGPEGMAKPLFDPNEVVALRAVLKSRSDSLLFVGLRRGRLDVSFQILGAGGRILHEVSDVGLLSMVFWAFDEDLEPSEQQQGQRSQGLPGRFEEAWTPPEAVKRMVLARAGGDDLVGADLISKMFSGDEPLRVFGDVLIEFAKAMNVCLVSDAYDSHFVGGFGYGAFSGDTPALFLDSFAQSTEQRWTYAEPWVGLRTQPYALARASTMPRSVLRILLKEKKELGGITFDTFASVISKLTDRQATSPAMTFATFSVGVFGSGLNLAGISFCRMWGSLSPVLKETLKQGGVIRRDLLPGDARGHLDRYLYLVEEEPLNLSLYMDEDYVSAIESAMERVGPSGKEDREFTQRFPNGVPPGAEIRLEHALRDGIEAQIKFGEQTAFSLPMSPDGYGAAGAFGDDEFAPTGFKLAKLERYLFYVSLSPDDVYTVRAGGATSDPKAEFMPFDSLPEGLRREIEQAKERARRRAGDPPPPGG
jgi:hypothetical protein